MKIMCIYSRLTPYIIRLHDSHERTTFRPTFWLSIALSLPLEEVSDGCLSCLEMFISSNSIRLSPQYLSNSHYCSKAVCHAVRCLSHLLRLSPQYISN